MYEYLKYFFANALIAEENTFIGPRGYTQWILLILTKLFLVHQNCPGHLYAAARWMGCLVVVFIKKIWCTHYHSCTHTHTLNNTAVVKLEGLCVFMCNIAKKLRDRTSNSVRDKFSPLWPSVAGSLMTSTILDQAGQRFPLRTGLFDLSAELVEPTGQGERPDGQATGQSCDELRLIAADYNWVRARSSF